MVTPFFGMDAASAARCFCQIIIAGREQQQKDGTIVVTNFIMDVIVIVCCRVFVF
jgi:hypothetical protein